MSPGDVAALRQRVDVALGVVIQSTRWETLKVSRAQLAAAVAERIALWCESEPEVASTAERTKRAVSVVDQLWSDLQRAAEQLRKCGVEKDAERARERAVSLGLEPDRAPLGGFSASLDACLIVERALEALDKWDGIHRPPAHRPPSPTAALTWQLRVVCCELGGFSRYEFADLCSALSHDEQLALPRLVPGTLEQRTTRARKRRRTDKVPSKSA